MALAALFLLASVSSGNEPAAKQYYVSPSGNDSWVGSATRPFKTIGRAILQLDNVVAKGFSGALTINIGQGAYYLTSPLVFDRDIYSSKKSKIIIRGNKGESVVISGGRKITGWQPAGKNLWSANVGNIIKGHAIRNLYKQDTRLIRSRQPNGNMYLDISNVEKQESVITLKKGIDAQIAPEDKTELVVLENWSISKTLVDHSDASNANRLYLAASAGFTEHSALIPKTGMACFLENSKSFLDSPGEWYHDEAAGKLFYFAADNENPNNENIIAPMLEKLVIISGAENAPVKNITFENIAFRHTDFTYPSRKFSGLQAGFFTLETRDPIYSEPTAIEVSFATDITFRNCSIAHTGGAGIGIGKGTRGNTIDDCHVYDIGGNGINIGHRITHLKIPPQGSPPLTNLSSDWEKPEYAPNGNIITGNFVEYCGQVNFGSVGIYEAFSRDTLITSNTVAHLPYTGISLGFNWSPTPTTNRDNTVEYNNIYDVMNVLADGGGIYTLGFQPGTILRKNLIHDIHRSKHTFGGAPNNGFFFDEGTTAIFVEGNIVYGVQKSATSFTPAEPIRFNNTEEKRLAWGKNSFGVARSHPFYPMDIEKEILKKTGTH